MQELTGEEQCLSCGNEMVEPRRGREQGSEEKMKTRPEKCHQTYKCIATIGNTVQKYSGYDGNAEEGVGSSNFDNLLKNKSSLCLGFRVQPDKKECQ